MYYNPPLQDNPQMFPLAVEIAKDILKTKNIQCGLCFTFSEHPLNLTEQGDRIYDYYNYIGTILQNPYASLGEDGEFNTTRQHLLETIIAIPPKDMYDILTNPNYLSRSSTYVTDQ